jgi:hypothetical protein
VSLRHATVVPSRSDIPDALEGSLIPMTSIIEAKSSTFLETDSARPFSLLSQENPSLLGASSNRMMTGASVGDVNIQDLPVEPVWSRPHHVIVGNPRIQKMCMLNNRRHVVTENEVGVVSLWDICQCIKIKDFSPPVCHDEEEKFFESVCERENTTEWIANWCHVDTKNGVIFGF